tara:strand:- start:109 stop:522 length:414 start_codon:yes stop_codon:yes gene_type:complete
MNIENIKKAIAIMERASNHDCIDMMEWQSREDATDFCNSEAELHKCRNKACFGGYVALSPEWQDDGGTVAYDGEPVMDSYKGSEAISYWLDIEDITARLLVYGDTDKHDFSHYYNKPWPEVEAQDVIDKLTELLEEG